MNLRFVIANESASGRHSWLVPILSGINLPHCWIKFWSAPVRLRTKKAGARLPHSKGCDFRRTCDRSCKQDSLVISVAFASFARAASFA